MTLLSAVDPEAHKPINSFVANVDPILYVDVISRIRLLVDGHLISEARSWSFVRLLRQ